MDLPELDGDPSYESFEARQSSRAELLAALSARFSELSTDEWLVRLRGRVPVAPVRSLQEALDVDELQSRGMLAEYEHPLFGTVRSVGLPLSMTGYEPDYRPGPDLGADAPDILEELGYGDDEARALRERGAFGSAVSAVPDAAGAG
jgi:crotonobetainyl-CoA:carnitine CoA-transferase CaiB-like acyl-CoA transferase